MQAANVDVALVVEGLQPAPDLARIERLLSLDWTSGVQPVVVLTKADLAPDAELCRDDVALAAPGVAVLVVSAVTGQGAATAAAALLAPGRTLALLGSSGTGKLTLVNPLAGTELMPTRALRADGKGRSPPRTASCSCSPPGGS